MVEMPEIATTSEIRRYLRVPAPTLYRWMSKGHFRRGIYLGRGRFNMQKLKYCIEKYGTFLTKSKNETIL